MSQQKEGFTLREQAVLDGFAHIEQLTGLEIDLEQILLAIGAHPHENGYLLYGHYIEIRKQERGDHMNRIILPPTQEECT